MKRVVFAGAALAFMAGLAVNPASAQDAIAARKDAMKAMGPGFYGLLPKMIRGEEPYDQAKVDAVFATIATSASKISGLWPDNSKPTAPQGTFNSSPKIWENKADFDAKLAKFVKDAGETKGKATNVDTLKTTQQALAQDCSGCHETYRVRNN